MRVSSTRPVSRSVASDVLMTWFLSSDRDVSMTVSADHDVMNAHPPMSAPNATSESSPYATSSCVRMPRVRQQSRGAGGSTSGASAAAAARTDGGTAIVCVCEVISTVAEPMRSRADDAAACGVMAASLVSGLRSVVLVISGFSRSTR